MNHRKTTWYLVPFILLMLVSFAWGADDPGQRATGQARAEWVEANVPQTPEAILQMAKDLLANPDVDGYEFCEQRLGIGRENWWNSPTNTREKAYLKTRANVPSLTPFQFIEAALDRQDKLYTLVLWLYKNPNFPLTPALTRQILGEPTEIWVGSPRDENSRGKYRIKYRYSTKKYFFDASFRNVDDAKDEMAIRKHTPEQISQEREYRKSFAVHKDYGPLSIELHRRSERP